MERKEQNALHGGEQHRQEGWREICRIIAVRCGRKQELNDVILRADNRVKSNWVCSVF